MTSITNLIFRTDASTQIGTGHVMRCLALAQGWQDSGGHSIFVIGIKNPVLEERLQSDGMEVVHILNQLGADDDAIQTADLALQMKTSCIVVDGYHFGANYQRIIKDSGLRLLTIDDNGHAKHYYADIVLNQNLHANEVLYANKEPYTQLLLGTRYVLLRREFLKWLEWKREMPEVARKVLITLGGSDPNNVTLKVIQALQQVEVNNLEAKIVIGANNPHYEELQCAIYDSRFPIRLESNVMNMPELMAWADVAVSSAGCTSWELAYMGLPSLLLVLATNQQLVAERLDTGGVAMNLGWHENLSSVVIGQAVARLLLSAGIRAEMSQHGRKLVDYEGTDRVLMHVKNKNLRLMKIREDDCRLLWEWANDLDVRASSFQTDPIPWEEHFAWFSRKIVDLNCYMYIFIDRDDCPIGQVRFDIQADGSAEVHISIAADKRGRGYGTEALKLACKNIFKDVSVTHVKACIKPLNIASIRAFRKADFTYQDKACVKGHEAVVMVLRRGK